MTGDGSGSLPTGKVCSRTSSKHLTKLACSSARLLLMTAVYYLLRTTGPSVSHIYDLPFYLVLMHNLITIYWFLLMFTIWLRPFIIEYSEE